MPAHRIPLEKRLRERIDTTPGQGPKGDCHEWRGTRLKKSQYGVIKDGKKMRKVYRIILERALGRPLGPGMQALHSCDNPPCCREEHLSEGTCADNHADRDAKGRQARGERQGRAVLTVAEVRDIRGLHSRGVSGDEIARRKGRPKSTIHNVLRGNTWKHVILDTCERCNAPTRSLCQAEQDGPFLCGSCLNEQEAL